MSASGRTNKEAREVLEEKYTQNALDKAMKTYNASTNGEKNTIYKNIIPTFTNDTSNDLEEQIDTLFEVAQMIHGNEPMNVGEFVEFLEEKFEPSYIDFLYYARQLSPLSRLEDLKEEILRGQDELLQKYVNGAKEGGRRKTRKRKTRRRTRKSRK